MASDRIPGPRGGTSPNDGAYQFPSLGGEVVLDLSAHVGRYINVRWIAATPDDENGTALFALFVAADDKTPIDSTSNSAEVEAGKGAVLVTHAPDPIASGATEPFVVPSDRPRLRLKPQSSAGYAVIRRAED